MSMPEPTALLPDGKPRLYWPGDCYFNCFKSLQPHEMIAHGFPLLRDRDQDGFMKPYGHAWLECAVLPNGISGQGPWVRDPTLQGDDRLAYVPRHAYYYMGGMINHRPIRHYTRQEADTLAVEHGHTGPWPEAHEDEYAAFSEKNWGSLHTPESYGNEPLPSQLKAAREAARLRGELHFGGLCALLLGENPSAVERAAMERELGVSPGDITQGHLDAMRALVVEHIKGMSEDSSLNPGR